MKQLSIPFACALALCLALPSHPSRADGPPKGATAEEIFKWADKNGDGKVTPDELPNPELFAKFDLNKDGVITLDEARQVLTAMKQERDAARAKAAQGGGPLAKFLGRLLERRNKVAVAPGTGAATNTAPAVIPGPRKIKPGDVGVGRQIADFAFTTLDGKQHQLGDWKSKAGVAIAYTSATCPVSKRYAPSLARLDKELAARNIALLLVNPFASEKPEDIAAQIRQQGFTAPYVHDIAGTVTRALDAHTTTEVFLLDPQRTLIYRGALDDQYGLTYNLDAPHESYLLGAVDAMLAGARPLVGATEAPGCELDAPSATAATKTQVTFHRDVERILQQNCVQCHHEKGIAPFALDDVAEVTDRAKVIKRVIETRIMPPWSAAPVPAGQANPWANDHSLSTRDKADLLAWLDSPDRPLGNPADAPAPLKFPGEWSIGKPDYIVQLKQPIAIKADGFMPYQFSTVETTLTEDKWVQAYEILPTAREVVHHVIVQVHEKGTPWRRGEEGGDGGYWAAYVPGNSGRTYPEGFARKLPAGATVIFQIHYTPSGKATQDQLRMGLVFAKEPPRYAMHTTAVAQHRLNIPPGDPNHVEIAEKVVPVDMPVTALLAHMHVRGKSFKFDVTYPDGKSETLLDIPRYDFNWQLRYEFKEPHILPRGSKVKLTAVYDNSPGNKANPDPAKTVHWGAQTYDEMMLGYFEYFTPMPSARKVAAAR